MFDIDQLVRKNIKALKPYSSARDEFQGQEGVFLDANENPYGTYNRYPDPYQRDLKRAISREKNVPMENIFLGNGSDEVIDLLFRVFCNPGMDKALTFSPTYGMYDVSAEINDVELLKIPLTQGFQIDLERTQRITNDERIKLLFICSPNNPTGNTMSESSIETVLESFTGIVVIDEAYVDFSSKSSWISRVSKFPNLVVMQTFSKARSLAGARVGMAFSSPEIIAYLSKVKPPYNISSLSQKAALDALESRSEFEGRLKLILSEKKQMEKQLAELSIVKHVYPSDANFLLVEVENADEIYQALIEEKLIVRNRSKAVKNCLRITIGTPEENAQLLQKMKAL